MVLYLTVDEKFNLHRLTPNFDGGLGNSVEARVSIFSFLAQKTKKLDFALDDPSALIDPNL